MLWRLALWCFLIAYSSAATTFTTEYITSTMTVECASSLSSHIDQPIATPLGSECHVESIEIAKTAKNVSTESHLVTLNFEQETCYFNQSALLKVFEGFFKYFLYPENEIQTKSGNSTLLSEDCVGVIDITRVFPGRELNTEYLFGLFSSSSHNTDNSDENNFSVVGRPIATNLVEFQASCNTIAASSIVTFEYPFLNKTHPIKVDIRMKMNQLGQVLAYEAIFNRFDWIFNQTLNEYAMILAGEREATVKGLQLVKDKTINSICHKAQSYCHGDNKQYESIDECVDYLSNVRFGFGYEGGMNTIWCRSIHQSMVQFNPTMHCPHIGPSGGSFCTDADRDYEAFTYFGLKSLPNMIVLS